MKQYRTEFAHRVLTVVRRIPVGRVATYGEVAAAAGRDGAARAVGNIMTGCNRPDVPCHRVIAAGGQLGGYGGNEGLKRALLMAEGVLVRGTRVDVKTFGWKSSAPKPSSPPPTTSTRGATRPSRRTARGATARRA
ncbi:MAG: methylated-DNA--[protein]-cysteine S-methyltransferase [Acidobacteriaceae bacterium]|jgi:O-6-methylguanine DNA methyltransferase|nr:methylated-DNA--[protein]-cysteine S-methyltransferase [Acidobacteriaceae bacterium]